MVSGHHVESLSCEWYNLDCVLGGEWSVDWQGPPLELCGLPSGPMATGSWEAVEGGVGLGWSREELLGGEEAPTGRRREEEERGVLSVGIRGWRVTA